MGVPGRNWLVIAKKKVKRVQRYLSELETSSCLAQHLSLLFRLCEDSHQMQLASLLSSRKLLGVLSDQELKGFQSKFYDKRSALNTNQSFRHPSLEKTERMAFRVS